MVVDNPEIEEEDQEVTRTSTFFDDMDYLWVKYHFTWELKDGLGPKEMEILFTCKH